MYTNNTRYSDQCIIIYRFIFLKCQGVQSAITTPRQRTPRESHVNANYVGEDDELESELRAFDWICEQNALKEQHNSNRDERHQSNTPVIIEGRYQQN